MDLEKYYYKNSDSKEWMQVFLYFLSAIPIHQFAHQVWRSKRGSCLKNDSNLFPWLIKCTDMIRMFFVIPSMMFILGAMSEQITMQLFDMILCEWDMLPRAIYQLHHFGISSNFLFIACSELSDLELSKECLDL